MHTNFAEYVSTMRTGWVIQDDGQGPYIRIQGSGEMPTDVEIDAWIVERQFTALRADRDARLRATDKYMLPDYPISVDALAQVKVYRAALRDLPDQNGAPWPDGGIPWPITPNV